MRFLNPMQVKYTKDIAKAYSFSRPRVNTAALWSFNPAENLHEAIEPNDP